MWPEKNPKKRGEIGLELTDTWQVEFDSRLNIGEVYRPTRVRLPNHNGLVPWPVQQTHSL